MDREAPKSGLTRRDWLVIIVFLALALVLRLPLLSRDSLWFDELWTWKVLQQPNLGALVTTGLQEDIHLPSYFVISYFFVKAFGDGEAILRLPAVIFGVLSVPMLYLFGKRVFNRASGFLAALMLALSYTSIYYSREARPYSMMVFMAILTSYLWYGVADMVVVRGEQPSRGLQIGLFVSLAVSCYTHYFSVMLTILQLLVYLAMTYRYKRGYRVAGWMTGGLVVLALVWLPELQLQLINLFRWIPRFDFTTAFSLHLVSTFGWVQEFGPAFSIVSWTGLALMLLFLYRGRKVAILRPESNADYQKAAVLVAAWFVPFMVAEIVSLIREPILVERYLLYTLPFAYLAVAYQISRIDIAGYTGSIALERFVQFAVVAALAVIPLYLVVDGAQVLSQNQKDDWRGVFAKMADENPKDGKVAVLAVTERLGVAQYYLRRSLPSLHVDAEARVPNKIPDAYQKVVAEHPAYIWLFLGQCVQPEQREAANLAGSLISSVADPEGEARAQTPNAFAVLFKVRAGATGH